MDKADVTAIFDYNYWANRRILTAASRVSQQQYAAQTRFPYGSLRRTLVHILDTEYGWRTLLQQVGETGRWDATELTEDELPTLQSVQERWREEEAGMRGYLATLTDRSLGEVVRYTTPEGNPRQRVLWHCLYHVVNHGTQHRSEAAAMLTDYDQSPGDIDFTLFMNERARPSP